MPTPDLSRPAEQQFPQRHRTLRLQEELVPPDQAHEREAAVRPHPIETILFVAAMSGPPKFRQRDPQATFRGEIDWSVVLNLLVWSAVVLWTVYRLYPCLSRGVLPKYVEPQGMAALCACLLCLSAIASPVPALTLYRSGQILAMLMFGYVWVRRYGVDATIRRLFLSYAFVCLLIVTAAFLAPETVFAGRDVGRLRGGTIAGTGPVSVLGLVVLLTYPVIRSRPTKTLLFIGFSTLLILSRTRSALAALAIAAVLLLVRRFGPGKVAVHVWLLIALVLLFLFALPYVFLGDALGSLEFRTGSALASLQIRTTTWHTLVETMLEKSPFLGLGFMATRLQIPDVPGLLRSAHSAYVAILSGGGLLSFGGMLLTLAMLAAQAATLYLRAPVEPSTVAVCGLLVVVLLVSVTSSGFAVAGPVGCTLHMLVSLVPVLLSKVTWRHKTGLSCGGKSTEWWPGKLG